MFLSKETRRNNVCGYLNQSFIEMQKRPEQEKTEQSQNIIIPNVAGVFEKLDYYFFITVHFKRLFHPEDKNAETELSQYAV